MCTGTGRSDAGTAGPLLRGTQAIGADPDLPTALRRVVDAAQELAGARHAAGSTRGGFPADDEELAECLAAVAGAAVHHARLREAARSRQAWLEAGTTITQRILTPPAAVAGSATGGPPGAGTVDPLWLVAEHVRSLAGVDVVAVAVPDGDPARGCAAPDLRVRMAVGSGDAQLVGARIAGTGTLSGQVHSSGEPGRAASSGDAFGRDAGAARGDLAAVMVVPLSGSCAPRGVLVAARVTGRPEFTDDDVEMAALFVHQAVVAIELAEDRSRQARASTADELERIAVDLNDRVISSLFATGLTLQGVVTTLDGGGSRTDAAARITASIRGLDDTIRQIRTVVFGLQPVPPPCGSVQARLKQVVAELAPAPSLRVAGALDGLADDVADDLVAVLRAALAGAAGSATTVEIDVAGGALTLAVTGDGTGCHGDLAELRRRTDHRGTLTLTPHRPGGRRLSWTVPL